MEIGSLMGWHVGGAHPATWSRMRREKERLLADSN